ncbi:MAG: hypothetical protein KGL93_11330 [Gemmatimonadota bacterium]|nr:hypothetical protein [Gemmatimonadota bacterium]
MAHIAAALALGLGVATTLPAQKTGARDSSMAGRMTHGMMHSMDSASHAGMMMPMGSGSHAGMGAMPGMMGMSGGSMATHMTQMLGVMQQRMATIQRLIADSAVARDPRTMQDLRQMQDHMATMMAAMQPMIDRMQKRTQRPDTSIHTPRPVTRE